MISAGYLSSQKAADYLGLPSVGAFRTLRCRLKAKGTPLRTYRLRGQLRFKQVDLDRLIEPLPKASGF